jgi:arylsulfatase A-like enzyme
VVDFRFPLAMYAGAVSYFDAQVGALAARLRELGIYDQSLIVVTAPHGEVLESPALPYHHFMLAPETLRVPLVMKPPARSGSARGVRLGGVFDLIDLFPTLLDMQGLKHSFEFSGASRWESIRAGADIPPHDSFASGFHGVAHSVYRPPHLFVKERAGIGAPTLHTLLSGGDEVVYDRASHSARPAGEIPESEALRAALDAWRRRFTDLT